jgi:hypothetical protein
MPKNPDTTSSASGSTLQEQQEQMVRNATNMAAAIAGSTADFVVGSMRICSELTIGLAGALLRIPAAVAESTLRPDPDGQTVPGMVGKAAQDSADLVNASAKRFTETIRSGGAKEV